MTGQQWRQDAACLNTDPARWFSDHRSPDERERSWQTQQICLRCPVIRQCAQDALDQGDRHGFRAGIYLASPARTERLQAIVDGQPPRRLPRPRPPRETREPGQLTTSELRAILGCDDRLTDAQIADRVGVPIADVALVMDGRRPEPAVKRRSPTRLTDEQIRDIRIRRAAGGRVAKLAARYGISTSAISALCSGQRRPDAPGPITPRRTA